MNDVQVYSYATLTVPDLRSKAESGLVSIWTGNSLGILVAAGLKKKKKNDVFFSVFYIWPFFFFSFFFFLLVGG